MSLHQKSDDLQDDANARPVALLAALILVAFALLFTILRMQPPAPKGVDAAPDEFSAGRVQAVLQELLAEDVPHPVGSENNDRVMRRIAANLETWGYEVDIQETVSCRSQSEIFAVCAPIKNILTQLPGQQSGSAVMLVAHYDSVRAGPGVADDSSNVAAMIEIARTLKRQGPYRNSIIFLFSDAEEVGFLGAQAFADEHPWAKNVEVVINMEARGTSGQSLMFETSGDNAWLVDVYASTVSRPVASSLFFQVYQILPNDTDLTVFRAAGMAGFNFAFLENPSHYHTPLDNLENLNLGSVQHQGESVLAVVRKLATMDLSDPPPGNAVYMDLLGFGVLKWPATWTIPLALLAMVLLLAMAGRLIRQGRLGVGALLWGILAALLIVTLPILLGLGLTWIISKVTGVPTPWQAYPLPARLSLWAGVLCCGGLVAGRLAQRAGWWGLGLGVWFFWSLLSFVLGLTLPGVAVVFLVPTLCATLLVAVVVFSGRSGSLLAREVAFIVAALVVGLIWLQLALRFESATGLELSPAITLSVALAVSTLAPLFAVPKTQRRVGKWVVVTTAVITVFAAIIAMIVPAYSEFSPQRLNMYHFEDRDMDTAYWVAGPPLEHIPALLRQSFDAQPLAVFPWSSRERAVAQAAVTEAPAPDLQLVSDERSAGGRVVRVRLRSPRGGQEIGLFVPVENLESVAAAGDTFEVDPEKSWNGFYDFRCYGRSCDGLELELQFGSVDSVKVLLVDYTSGLPSTGEHLTRARLATAVPVQSGDSTIILRRVELFSAVHSSGE